MPRATALEAFARVAPLYLDWLRADLDPGDCGCKSRELAAGVPLFTCNPSDFKGLGELVEIIPIA